jgi:hypothetical protein
MTTKEQVLTQSDLAQFTGTETWYRHSLARQITYTEGARYVADKASAYWLLDIIVSYQFDPKVKAEEFQVWELTVNAEHKGEVLATDGNGNVIAKQTIEYTDFPLAEIKFYFADNVILLPSEY